MTKQIHPKITPNDSLSASVESAIPAHSLGKVAQTLPTSQLQTEIDNLPSSTQPGLNLGRSLTQIVVVMFVLLMLVNVPFNNYRDGLAQLLPQSTSVVIREGLLLKGSGLEIYRVEDYTLRRISSPEILALYFNKNSIITVEDSFIEQFAQGRPIHRMVRCENSTTIYALENGQKHWIKDPPPANPTKPWDKVVVISCVALHRLPDGLPIPEDAGEPPQS